MTTFTIISIAFSIAVLVFWLWMFADFMNNHDILGTHRMYWLAAFLFLNILTAGYYYFTIYNEREL